MENKNENIAGDKTLLREIASAVREIRYGEVVITIHNSSVVEIEKREKKRFALRPENRSR